MIGFRIELGSRVGGRGCIPKHEMLDGDVQTDSLYVLNSNIVLNQPLVDSFRWVRHKDTPFEIRLREYIR